MGKEAKERLIQTLSSHLNIIHETFQVLDQTPASSLEKIIWEEVIKMGDQVSKQATIAGMVWTGERPEVSAVEENMVSYFNVLQGFLLLSHGSQVGAGPTLSSNIHASVKNVVDCSFKLWKESVALYGSHNKDKKLSIPQLVGAVWEACSSLKKTPATNVTAIGRAMTQVAVSVKDVLREMKELKPGSSDLTDEADKESSSISENKSHDDDDDDDVSEGDLGNDLTPEEMKIAQSAVTVVSETLSVLKELIRTITTLLKLENANGKSNFVNSLENLLKLCQEIGVQIDELGACLYSPQEIHSIKAASEKISSNIDDILAVTKSFEVSCEVFLQACNSLRISLVKLESELGISSAAALRRQNSECCFDPLEEKEGGDGS